jgi:hypothetical protein
MHLHVRMHMCAECTHTYIRSTMPYHCEDHELRYTSTCCPLVCIQCTLPHILRLPGGGEVRQIEGAFVIRQDSGFFSQFIK